MTLNIEDTVAELEAATILRLSELVKATEEKFDVSVTTPVAVAGPAAGGAAEEQTELTIKSTAAGDQKVKVIKAVREATGLGLKEAKVVVGGASTSVKEGVSKGEAEALEATLEEVGASVAVKWFTH